MPEKPPRAMQDETEVDTEKDKPTVSKQQAKQQAQRPNAPSEVASEKAAAETLPVPMAANVPVPVMPGNLEGLWKLSDALARAKILPDHLTDNGRADLATIKANVFWVIQCGAELNIPACQAIMGIAIINKRPCVYGDLMIGKVRASALVEYILETSEGEGDNLVCYCEAKRRDTGEVIVRSYSWKEADQVVQKTKFGDKKLTDKDTYRNYGPRMIAIRARAFCLRDGFSDVLKGIRVVEEEEDQAYLGPVQQIEAPPRPQPPKTEKAIEGEIVDEAEDTEPEDTEPEPNEYQQSADSLIGGLEAAVNVEDLDALWDNSLPVYEDLPGDLRKFVEGKYEELRAGLAQSPLAAG